jgi:two-component system response regulator NreC
MPEIRVMLVDDHAVLLAGLRALLAEQENIHVVGEAGTADEALDLLPQVKPDILIMDLGMPGMSAFDAIRQIRSENPEIRVVVLSMHKGYEIVARSLEAGADGFVPKSSAHTGLLHAIQAVYSGRPYLHPTATTVIVETMRNSGEADLLLKSLSDREQEVMRWTARGFSSREIGEKLSISSKTVDTYRQRIMQKLNLGHRSELVDLAFRAGLLGDKTA